MDKILEYIRECESDDCIDEEFAIELITECNYEWKSPDLDAHRWYSRREVVVEYHGKYIKYWEYIITGDSSMSDMDLEYTLGDFTFVEKKTRIIEEVYYE